METLTAWLSIIALIVSIGSFFLSLKAFNRDKPDLHVSLDYWPQDGKEICFNVRVTNHGRRVALIEIVRIHFSHGEPLTEFIAGGQPINEGEPFDCQLLIHGSHNPAKVKFAEVIDTLERRYKFPKISIKDWIAFGQLKAKTRQLLNKGKQFDKARNRNVRK